MSVIKLNHLPAFIALVSLTWTICNSGKCERWKQVELPNADHFPNESVWDSDSQIFYPPNTYWNYSYNNGSTRLYGCPCKLDKPCMRKCCQKNEAMDYDTLECIPHNATWPWFRPNVTADDEGNFRMENFDYFGLIFGNFCFGYPLKPEFYPEEDQFYVNFTDGTLSVLNKTGLGPEDYCLEYFPEKNTYLPYVCLSTLGTASTDNCSELYYLFYSLGMLISTVFLIISLCAHVFIPELRNLYGKCLMCYMANLVFVYCTVIIVQELGLLLSNEACVIYGFVIYFSLLCTFFWLNILSIDIFIAFSSIRPRICSMPEHETRKFLYYMLYAWGVPFVITMITAIMEFHPDIPHTYYKPNFKISCWFHSNESILVYFILPIGVIVFCNILLFLVTARNIFKMKKESKMQTGGRRKDKREYRNRFQLCIKLSIVMGISWAMEILSSLIGGSKCIWLFTDTLNTLQGFFIFLIFVGNKKVWHLIKRRLCHKRATDGSLSVEIHSNTTEEPSGNTSFPIVQPKYGNQSCNLTLKANNETTNTNQRQLTERDEENTRL